MIRIILHGCNGRMGQTISKMILEEEKFQIVAGIDKKLRTENPYPTYECLEECQMTADVVIDFSTATAVRELASWCTKREVPLILCTTGMKDEEMYQIQKAAEKIPIVCASNLSPGIHIIMKILENYGEILRDAGYDIKIIEKHHKGKIDAPSGTSLALANALEGQQNTEILSLRGGTIVGEHEIICAGMDEVLTLKHTAYSRKLFGKGALISAEKILGKQPGIYDFGDLL